MKYYSLLLKGFVYLLITLCINFDLYSQGSIGQTEEEIKSEYGGNPDVSVYVKTIDGERNIIVVNKDATASFAINNATKLCSKSMIQFRNNEVLQEMVRKLDSNYTVVTAGAAWTTTLKGHTIKIELRYSTKLKSNILVFYQLT